MSVMNKRTTTCSVIVRPPIHRLLTLLLVVCLPCIVVCFVQETPPPPHHVICLNPNADEPLPFLEVVLLANVILYGRIVGTFEDTRYAAGVYTAQMEVYCIVKGRRTSRIVNITEAGYLPERCFSADLFTGNKYVVLASFDGSKYRPFDTEKPGTEATLKEVARTCNIDPKYPIDVTEHQAMHRCPTPTPPGECIDRDHFTTATSTTEPPPTDDDGFEYPTDDPVVIVEPNPNGGDNHQRPSSSNGPVLLTSLVLLSTLDKILGAGLDY